MKPTDTSKMNATQFAEFRKKIRQALYRYGNHVEVLVNIKGIGEIPARGYYHFTRGDIHAKN